ncbi:MAG: transcriptional regulator, RpiR family [Rhizobacter sp.]|nr:transcriptional regulator, RpiR family [Rhizobacter sp.]
MPRAPAPPKLGDRITDQFARMTRSERSIATYMLGNLHLLPFESAAGIAAKVGVSQMTVGRFLRSIGYDGIWEVKEELREATLSPGLKVGGRLERLRTGNDGAGEGLHRNLQMEVNALVSVYEHVGTPLWNKAIGHLTKADNVFVTGFQTVSGLASDFAARLQYLRAGVSFLDGRDGTFADLLAGTSATPCLVVFEMRRYTKFSQLLAQKAQERGIALIVICDRHCLWAHDHTDLVFTVNTDGTLFWDNQTPFLSLTNLMFDHIVRRLRTSVDARLKAMAELQEHFGAFPE